MSLARAVGVAHKAHGPAVGDLQRALLKLGYYGIRFAIDGDYGRNTLGAVLACKYDLASVYGMTRRDLTYAPRAGSPGSLSASGEVTAVFVEAIQTPFPALPRPMPDYVVSMSANVRTAIRLFIRKFAAFSKRNPCVHPTRAAPSFDCRTCLRARGFDTSAYSDGVQQPCSWLKAVWAYNGVTPAGRRYMEQVVRHVLR